MCPLFEEIVNEVLYSANRPYKMQHPDELFGYTLLGREYTGLNYPIFADDEKSYIKDKHQPLLFVKNGNNSNEMDFIPFSLSIRPIILDRQIDVKISAKDIAMIQLFIRKNLFVLLNFANEKMTHLEFFKAIKPVEKMLSEMSKLSKEITNLPMDIWVDEAATFQGHAPRLKFQASKDQKTTREYSTMLLSDPPVIENLPRKVNLKTKDIKKLEDFVLANFKALNQLARNEINLRDFFEIAHFPKKDD